MKRLIDLTHSPYPSLKIIAAEHMQYYIKDFPELEDEAINAVYDLCEDQVSQVSPVFLVVLSSVNMNMYTIEGPNQRLCCHRQRIQGTAKMGQTKRRCIGPIASKW